ncbi:MAG: GNAT family N-acetyltransferase [Dehalococcoidia bacterium]|nr:GNAT family N-acetyltransferase [Dehalococcoidia bacterium]
MSVNVRRAARSDASAIAEIITELQREQEPIGVQGAWDEARVLQQMDHQGEAGAYFVVEDIDRGSRILGFAAIDFNSEESEQATFGAWIRAVNRRQGHATRLAEECLAFARSKGYKRIRARLPEGNEPALSYLSSIGALVPLFNPGTSFELPIYQETDRP